LERVGRKEIERGEGRRQGAALGHGYFIGNCSP
jgi:hypothetical protein